MRILHPSLPLVSLVSIVALGCTPGGDRSTSALVVTDACDIFGAGALPAGDVMDGDVSGGSGEASGSWSHTTADGQTVEATPEGVLCRINGATVGDHWGAARLNGEEGYTYLVRVHDEADGEHGQGVGAAQTVTLTASRTYRPSDWADGSVQFEGGALVTVPAEITVTAGNAGNQWAWLTFDRDEGLDPITCRYRGGADTPLPDAADDGGLAFYLERCTGDDGDEIDTAGAVDHVLSVTLHVHTGAHAQPSRDDAYTEVAAHLQVRAYEEQAFADHYRLVVFDSSEAIVLDREGDLASGDLTVSQF